MVGVHQKITVKNHRFAKDSRHNFLFTFVINKVMTSGL